MGEHGRVAIVTGAGSGIGAATALAFLAGRYLKPGGTVLATAALVAAASVPALVLQTDEADLLR